MEETQEGLALALATREEIKSRKRKLEEKVRCCPVNVCTVVPNLLVKQCTQFKRNSHEILILR